MTDPETVADVLAQFHDDFNGDDGHLVRCIQALLSLDAKGALAPHGIGDHARGLLSAAMHRLARNVEPALAASAAPVCIVWDWEGDTERFIEEEIDGASVSLPWHERPDGLKELRIERIAHAPPAVPVESLGRDAPAVFGHGNSCGACGDGCKDRGACRLADESPHLHMPAPTPASVPDGLTADDVQWIVNDNAELGVMIRGKAFFLYKGHSLVYDDAKHDDGTPMYYRTVGKREFGECAYPINHRDYSKRGTVSIDDSDRWQLLPPTTPESRT